jgi:hypothetical protein
MSNYLAIFADEISKATKTKPYVNEKRENHELSREAKAMSVNNMWTTDKRTDCQLQKCVLSYIGGSILRQWKKSVGCEKCVTALMETTIHNVFLKNKQFGHCKPGQGLIQPTPLLLNTLCTLENIFISYYSAYFCKHRVLLHLMNSCLSVSFITPLCHSNLREFIFKKFIIRIHHQCKLMTRTVKAGLRRKTYRHVGLNLIIS